MRSTQLAPLPSSSRTPSVARRALASPVVSSSPYGFTQRASSCACGGGCPRCQSAALQRKPRISSPGDRLEREADDVADRVMRMAQPAPIAGAPDDGLARNGSGWAAEDKVAVQRAASAQQGAVPNADAAASAAGSGGAPLSSDLRAYFEPRLGHDLGAVRVHTDGQAAAAAQAVRARAYTLGRDIVFDRGQFAPGTGEGKRLLAHELAHVVQQDTGAVEDDAFIARSIYDTADAELEAEEEIRNKKWNAAYGRDPSQQYGAERGSIDEDVTYIGKDKKPHTRHQPALGPASDATGPGGGKGTKMAMGKGITDADVETVMTDPGYGAQDLAEIKQAATGAGARITEAFKVMQIDTLEAQALYLAHAAVESRGLRSMTAQADPSVVGKFPGRGPLQVTFQQAYVKTLAYLDEQVKRLEGQGRKEEADQARAASAAVKADPAAAADTRYAFIFSAAYMHASGGVQASPEMSGKTANFGGTGPEDRWESGGDNFDERIAYWTGEKAKGNAAADERLSYWTGVKAAGQRKAKAYDRAIAVLKKNVAQSTAEP